MTLKLDWSGTDLPDLGKFEINARNELQSVKWNKNVSVYTDVKEWMNI